MEGGSRYSAFYRGGGSGQDLTQSDVSEEGLRVGVGISRTARA